MVGDFIQKAGVNLVKIGFSVVITNLARESMQECFRALGKDVNRLRTGIKDRRLQEN